MNPGFEDKRQPSFWWRSSRNLLSPLLDRRGEFSLMKALTLTCILAPVLHLAHRWHGGSYFIPEVDLLIGTGDWSTWFLLASLTVTPLRRITGWSELLSLRRMIGLAGLAYAIAHLPFYFALRLWDLQFVLSDIGSRISLILAVLSLIGLCALGATSFDAAIRWMGGERWNRLHAWVYPLTGLAVVHYLMTPDALAGTPYLIAGIFVWLMAWRVIQHRYRLGADPRVLVLLAVATAVFTAVFEALWIWLFQTKSQGLNMYFDGDPWQTLAANFDPAWWQTIGIGISPALAVLLAGLLAAAAAAAREQVNQKGRRIGNLASKILRPRTALAVLGVGAGLWLALMLMPPSAPPEGASLDIGAILNANAASVAPGTAAEPDNEITRFLVFFASAAAGLAFGLVVERGVRGCGTQGVNRRLRT